MVLMAYLLKEGVSYSAIEEMPEKELMEIVTVLTAMDELKAEIMQNG